MTQPESPEFLAILERVPRWHMLTPDEQIKDSDEIWRHGDQVSGVWKKVIAIGTVNSRPFRRLIPEHVRRSEAWFQLLSAVCREHSGNPDYSTVIYVCLSQGATISGVFGPDLAEKLGTDDDCEKFMEEGPGAYMRWVLGNK